MIQRFQDARRDSALAVLEGLHAVKHAVRFGAELSDVVVEDRARVAAIAALLAPDVWPAIDALACDVAAGNLARIRMPPPPTGILALARRRPADPAAVLAGRDAAPVVFLEDVTNPLNLGAAVRVAAAAGAAGVFSSGAHDPWQPEAVRAAAGLQYALPVMRIGVLPRSDRPLVAVDPGGARLVAGAVPGRAVLAFGSERRGLSRAVLEAADVVVGIPMRAGVSSLNLATAVAVVLYACQLALPAGDSPSLSVEA